MIVLHDSYIVYYSFNKLFVVRSLSAKIIIAVGVVLLVVEEENIINQKPFLNSK